MGKINNLYQNHLDDIINARSKLRFWAKQLMQRKGVYGQKRLRTTALQDALCKHDNRTDVISKT